MIAAISLFFGNYARIIALVVLVALLGALGVQTVRLEHAQTKVAQTEASFAKYQADVATAHAAAEKQRADDERQARATERGLQQVIADNNQKAADEKAVLDSRVAALRDQLRKRPSRPEGSAQGGAVAATPGAPAGNTGAGLYREDGEFLAGEAASAATVAGERDECRRIYDAAREALRNGSPK